MEMSDHIEATIAEFQKKLHEQEREVIKTKQMINQLCEFAGKPPIYNDTDMEPSAAQGLIRSDQFYGQPLATAVRKALEMRKAIGPATVKDIYELLKQGGYAFETSNDANAMRNLRISLSKNVALFHKLPNGRFGLTAWYPNIKKGKSAKSEAAATMQADENEDASEATENEEGTE